MTASEGHRARMDSDTPRGYGVRGDVRKRLEGQHQAHPDPAVRDLLAAVRAETLEECAGHLRDAIEVRSDGLDPGDAGYVDGWNAAAQFFAAALTVAASEIRATS